ncbi:hypothetical protein SKAU_G00037990 [Synaphobranchus kaupii]|uniref:Uncharacterized protein n=1 Tax=Synaphobranchus kaupii TaxID=118154 RepID=A0A9Q1JDV3_SYNKA|nr:hypothetical protein SKAU_G00037990 [Synaphobranchus kaupii]
MIRDPMRRGRETVRRQDRRGVTNAGSPIGLRREPEALCAFTVVAVVPRIALTARNAVTVTFGAPRLAAVLEKII